MHRVLLSTLMIDVPSAVVDETVGFWSGALGATPMQTKMPQYHILDDAAPPSRVVVQDSGDGEARIHFDLHTDDMEADVARLEKLGATVVDRQWVDHPGSWIIMRDPAGMEFCVVWALNPIRPQAVIDDFLARAKWVE
jgi:predicted enzyme related to lactoylglutathione lyase